MTDDQATEFMDTLEAWIRNMTSDTQTERQWSERRQMRCELIAMLQANCPPEAQSE